MGRVVEKISGWNERKGVIAGAVMAVICVLISHPLSAEAASVGMTATATQEKPLPPPHPALARIPFSDGDASISKKAEDDLIAFAHDFRRKSGRLMITAYAGPPRDQSLNARRISLKRARRVRDILMREGIVKERILVRALGGVEDSGPTERVDIGYAGR